MTSRDVSRHVLVSGRLGHLRDLGQDRGALGHRPSLDCGGGATDRGLPRAVMEVLGHSQINITMNTYTHVSTAVCTERGRPDRGQRKGLDHQLRSESLRCSNAYFWSTVGARPVNGLASSGPLVGRTVEATPGVEPGLDESNPRPTHYESQAVSPPV